MKKSRIIFFIIVFIILLTLTNCTLSNSNGRITVMNFTNITLTNVKIGNNIISLYVSPGDQVDYWYYSEFNGNFTLNGIDDSLQYDVLSGAAEKYKYALIDIEYKLKLGYQVTFIADIRKSDYTNSKGEVIKKGDPYIYVLANKFNDDDQIEYSDYMK